MMFEGRLWKEGKFWLIEAPMLDVMTQGKTKAHALAMLQEAIELLADRHDFSVTVKLHGEGVTISSKETGTLIALALRRQRLKHGLSLAEVATRLKQASRNSYARYEQGRSVPSIEKLEELFRAVGTEALMLRCA
jgi:predicted RNase H-like HicB family nuclease/DNA-binding XRE family transcriptional regulator